MRLLSAMQLELAKRMFTHDRSKLVSPELEMFEECTCRLRELTYGSPEYFEQLRHMREDGALAHHYANNRHHPEFFENGIEGMNLIDVLEMVCDWAAAVRRHNDGSLEKSIEINRDRFGLSDQLVQIIKNTVPILVDPYEHLGNTQVNL